MQLRAQGQGSRIAVLVGISRYPDVEGIPGLRFADRDALRFETYLRSARSGRFDRLIVLTEDRATRKAILAAVRQAVNTAGPSGQVYLFLSARGRATPASPEGSIFAYDSKDEKNSSISLSELQQILQVPRGPQIFLFADLCRTPAEWQPQENRINFRLEDLGRSLARFTGLLASEGAQRSYEDQALEQGHGVFSYFMVDAVRARAAAVDANGDGRIDMSELYGYLRRELPLLLQYGRQRPKLIGVRENKLSLADLQYPVAWNGFFRAPHLFASAGPMQDVPTQRAQESQAAYETALREGRLTGPQGAAEILEHLRPLLVQADWELERDRLEAAFEGEGQELLSRYGTGDRFPDDPKWRQLEMTAADYARGERSFREAIRLHPQDPSLAAKALFCAGRAAALNGDPVSARQRFLEAISRDPALAEPHNALGVIYLQSGDYNPAAAAFRAAQAAAPRWAFPRHNLALTAIEAGDFRGAERAYEAAIVDTPYYPYLHYNLGVLYHRLRSLRQAERAYRNSIKAFRAQAAAFDARALQWTAAGNAIESDRARAFGDALRRNEAEAHNGLAVVYESRGRRSPAILEYQVALAANPNLLPAVHNLALLYRAQGNTGEALRLWRQNLAADPNYLPSQLAIAESYLSAHDYGEAERHYRQALASQPGQVSAQHGVAVALAGQERIAEAIAEELKTIDLQTRQPGQMAGGRFYEFLGDLFGRSGDAGRACEQYRYAGQATRTSVDGPSNQLARKLKACR